MNRGILGVILLLVLLAGGILSSRFMECPLEGMMEQAAECALTSDWEQAEQLQQSVKSRWDRRWHVAAAFSDHAPMERIDSLFAQLEVYAGKEPLGYAALCRELAREMEAMGEAHVPNWWNLL